MTVANEAARSVVFSSFATFSRVVRQLHKTSLASHTNTEYYPRDPEKAQILIQDSHAYIFMIEHLKAVDNHNRESRISWQTCAVAVIPAVPALLRVSRLCSCYRVRTDVLLLTCFLDIQSSTASDLDHHTMQVILSPVRLVSRACTSSRLPVLASRSHLHSASKPKVLLLDQIKLATTELGQLSKVANVVESTAKTRQELIEKFQSGGEYAQVVGIYRHFGGARSIKVTGRFDAELVSQLPSTLRYIVHNGAGYDQLDVQALSDKGIQASNVPTAVDDATSDVALYLLLGALRRFPRAKAQMNAGKFNSAFSFLDARDPRGKTLGIVGAGGIGRAFAHKASHALGVKVIYHNRNQLSSDVESQAAKGGMKYAKTLEELLQQSDIVSLHCPLTPATKGLIGKQQLEMMKKDAILINTARGPVVKEDELAEALEQGVIAGAGLDVFEAEVCVHTIQWLPTGIAEHLQTC